MAIKRSQLIFACNFVKKRILMQFSLLDLTSPQQSMQPFGHNRHGPKIGGSVLFFGEGGAGLPYNTMLLWSRPTFIPSGILIHRAICPQQTWTENWGLCLFEGGGPRSPSNTMWPGRRPTCVPSFIFIRPTVWPQYTNVTDMTGHRDRTDRQTDNGPIA